MSGWRKLEKDMVETEIFHHPEDIRMYVWILIHATHKDGVQVGDVVLREGQYIRSIGKLQEDLWFYNGKKKDAYATSRIQRSIKRLEKCGWLKAEKFKHGFIFTVRPVKDPKCGEYLKWMGIPMEVKGDDGSTDDQPDEGAGTLLSSVRESDMKEERMSCENRLKNLEKEEIVENNSINTTATRDAKDVDRLQALIGHFVGRRGRGFLLTPMDHVAMERISLSELSTDELIVFMDEQFDKQESINPKLTINSPRYLEKALEAYISPRESMQHIDDLLDGLEEIVTEA
ncbi:hypothetical protein [Rossellomorea aquimaris]|uniref:Uncharacterized protein n=1 Tax=Rossellomorea aquimaris TaxID=189382 RepID=A0A366ED00_9BACI|nr:hypothetical protein [Rossellomorea aquimaris]RBP00198.1 hypothetical protein DET59_12515 [Rossellomorea aquimaris]